MSKPRLPISVLAALGLGAAGMRCNPIEVLGPCLSIAVDPDDDSDTADKHDDGPANIVPCLSPVQQPPIGPCLTPMEPPDEPPMTPCLSPMPEPPIEPEMTVCLSVPYIEPPPQLDEPSTDDKSAVHTVEKAKQAVLKRGILPADVAARLLRDNKE